MRASPLGDVPGESCPVIPRISPENQILHLPGGDRVSMWCVPRTNAVRVDLSACVPSLHDSVALQHRKIPRSHASPRGLTVPCGVTFHRRPGSAEGVLWDRTQMPQRHFATTIQTTNATPLLSGLSHPRWGTGYGPTTSSVAFPLRLPPCH